MKERSFFSGRRHTIVYPLHHNCEVRAMGKKSKLTHKPVSGSRVLRRPMTWPACLCPKSPRQMEGHKQDKRRLGSLRLRISQGTDQAHFSQQEYKGHLCHPNYINTPTRLLLQHGPLLQRHYNLSSRSSMSYRYEMTGLGRAQDVFPNLDRKDGPQPKSHSSLTHILAR